MTPRTRPSRALGVACMLAVATAGCTSPSDAAAAGTVKPPESTETTATTERPALPAVSLASAAADQTPPLSTLGLWYHENQLWIADFYAGQVLAVDPDSGTIVRRLTSEDNVSDEVVNVVVSPDDVIYWIGLNDGAVAVLQGIASRQLERVPPGTTTVALSGDGRTLYAGGAIGRPGPLWRIDVNNEIPKAVAGDLDGKGKGTPIRLRSLAVTTDGTIYGVRFGPPAGAPEGHGGALVQVDPTTGVTVDVTPGIDSPIAVKLSPDGHTAYVLSLPPGSPPALTSVDLTTKVATAMPRPRTPLADSLAVGPDGRIFVSAYNAPEVSVISPDGTVKTLPIGRKPIK